MYELVLAHVHGFEREESYGRLHSCAGCGCGHGWWSVNLTYLCFEPEVVGMRACIQAIIIRLVTLVIATRPSTQETCTKHFHYTATTESFC